MIALRPRPAAVAVAALLSAAASAAPAQPVVPAPAGARPGSRPPVRGGLPVGQRVRLAVGGGRVTGRLDGTAGDTLLVRVGPGESLRTPVAGVDSLWVDVRGTVPGAKVGAVAGGLALGGFGLLLAYGGCDQPSCSPGRQEFGTVLLAATIGAAGGALAGGIVGLLVPRWRRVYP